MTIAYRLLLKAFPALDYNSKHGVRWGTLFRFDIADDADQEVYLRRFVLLRTPYGSVYLHHILRSDHDRCLHDHPWNSFIIILWGGYCEVTPDGNRIRCPGSFRRMPALTRHRVLLHARPDEFGDVFGGKGTDETPAWTICCVGQKVRDWGFWQKGEWVHWRAFLSGDREC